MSETVNETPNTGETTGASTTPTASVSTSTATSWLNLAIESVMDLIDAMGNFANITRGALGIDDGLCCEVAPSNAPEVYYDKNA